MVDVTGSQWSTMIYTFLGPYNGGVFIPEIKLQEHFWGWKLPAIDSLSENKSVVWSTNSPLLVVLVRPRSTSKKPTVTYPLKIHRIFLELPWTASIFNVESCRVTVLWLRPMIWISLSGLAQRMVPDLNSLPICAYLYPKNEKMYEKMN